MKRLLLTTTALCCVAFPAQADLVTAAIQTLAMFGANYAVTGTTLTVFGLGTLASIATIFTANLALGQLSTSLAPKPNKTTPVVGYEIAGIAKAADHAIIYGQTRVGGVVVYKETTPVNSNKDLHLVVAIAGHECEDLVSVYLDDEALSLGAPIDIAYGNLSLPFYGAVNYYGTEDVVTSPAKYTGKVTVSKHLGTPNQEADVSLVASSNGKWTPQHTLSGITYVYMKLIHDQDVFSNGEPSISFIIKGKKVYDPDTQTYVYSDNAALCLLDYLMSDYGMGIDLDEIDLASFSAAKEVCDDDITLAAGGTEKRYTINGTFTTSSKPNEVIDKLLNSMAGVLWYSAGKWKVKAGEYTTPVLSLNEDDLRSGLRINTRVSRRDNFNIVRGTFRGAVSNYQQTDFPQIRSQTFVDIDNGMESSVDLDLGFTETPTMAQRIAKIALYRGREQLTLSASFGMRAFQLEVGDVVQFTNTRAGWTDKTFEVTSWTFAPNEDQSLVVNMVLREISAAVYDWEAEETAFELNNTSLVSPFDKPTIGLEQYVTTKVLNEKIVSILNLNVTSGQSERVDYVIVEYKESTDTEYTQIGVGELGAFQVFDIEDGTYDIRARAVTALGVKGEYTTLSSQVIEAPLRVPSNVSNFTATVTGGTVNLEWEAVSDVDLSHYEVRHAHEETGATWANSRYVVDKVSRPATSVSVPARSGTYMIRSYNKQGIESESYTSFVVPSTHLEVFGTTLYVTEHTAFSGTKIDVIDDYLGDAIMINEKDAYIYLDAENNPHVKWFNVLLAMVDYIGDVYDETDGGIYAVIHETYESYQRGDLDTNETIEQLDVLYLLKFLRGELSAAATQDLQIQLGDPILAAYKNDEAWAQPNSNERKIGRYFTGYIDTGSVRKVRARLEMQIQRTAYGQSPLFDDIVGYSNEWVGQFDDLSDGDELEFGDVNVISYISTTDDDPAGSPTWSSYKLFKSGDFSGRAFRFKIDLTRDSVAVNTRIDYLRGVVQY